MPNDITIYLSSEQKESINQNNDPQNVSFDEMPVQSKESYVNKNQMIVGAAFISAGKTAARFATDNYGNITGDNQAQQSINNVMGLGQGFANLGGAFILGGGPLAGIYAGTALLNAGLNEATRQVNLRKQVIRNELVNESRGKMLSNGGR